MKTYTLKKITMFDKRNTKVKVEIADGTYLATGEGIARCADGDDFDEETGEEIAEIRARLEALNDMIEEYQERISVHKALIEEKKTDIKNLQQIKKNLQERLDYLIED